MPNRLVFLHRIKRILDSNKVNFRERQTETGTKKLWSSVLTASSFAGFSCLLMFNKSFLSWIREWFRWCPTSEGLLEQAEKKLFSYVKSDYELDFVTVTHNNGSNEECRIRSLIVNKDAQDKATPLVLLHGFASGSALWVLNLDSLTQDRTVYAFDLLGFGRSSRPYFSSDPEVAENQFVESIEQWRKQVQLEKFILLGHSMGGFLATSYALQYPERVKHLILADPWGFPETDMTVKRIEIPLWAKVIAAMLRPFNPLAGLRAAGPWGPNLVQRLRPDILGKFQPLIEDPTDVSNYIYHCNAQTPSGETAFKALNARFGWAKRPMISRVPHLKQDIPITFIYGSRSWIDSNSGLQTAELRNNSCVKIKLIQGAGHHVYADKVDEFNRMVCNLCRNVDSKESHLHDETFDKYRKEILSEQTQNATEDERSKLPATV